MSPRVASVDGNQNDIVDALRAAGARVQLLHTVGHGCPDTLVAFRGAWYVAEIKNPQGRNRLTPDQVRWHEDFGIHATIYIWRTIRQALCDIGAARWEDLQ